VSNRQEETMRFWALALIGVLGAVGVGATGVPGKALAAVTMWLDTEGHVELRGPVGDAVKHAL
jgi:hypothetical protein